MNQMQYRLYRMFRWVHMKCFGMKPGCFIQDPEYTRLGIGVQLSHGTQIYVRNHNVRVTKFLDPPEKVVIDDECWLGANVIVLPGVHLGPHCIVGAGSVVTKSFPDGWCVLAGVPAKVVKQIEC